MRDRGKLVIWPIYLDQTKSRSSGRIISRKNAIKEPQLNEIKEAARQLGLNPEVEPHKAYPKSWWEVSGRVLVDDHEIDSNSHIYSASSIVDLVKEYNGGVIPDTSQEIENIYSEIPETQKDRYVYGNNMLLLNFNIGNAVADIKVTGIEELRNIVQQDMQWMPAPPGTAVTITGNSVVYIEVISALTSGRIAMTFLGLILVLAGLLIVYKDWVKALVPVIPMLIVIGWSGGVMSLLNISYTPLTATLGALILGVGSEYAILMFFVVCNIQIESLC